MIKVLHINCTDAGSTGKIIGEISKQLKNENGCSVLCTPKITSPENINLKKMKISNRYEQALYKRITAFTGYRYSSSPTATLKIIKIIKKEKPDVIHMHSANCYMANIYKILKYAARKDIAVVITNHAEFYYTGNCSHAYECEQWRTGCLSCPDLWGATHSKIFDVTSKTWKKMKLSLSAVPRIIVVSVSPWVRCRSEASGIMQGIPQCTVLNGVDIGTFKRSGDEDALKMKYNLQGKIILFVTAMFSDSDTDVKGGRFIIELAKKIHSEATVVVVGKKNLQSILPSNIIAIGEVKDQNVLAEYYTLADVVVVVGKKETFGMTVAESLCCGTPVVGFNAGGPESIALPEYSEFVAYGDVEALYAATQRKLQCSKKEISQSIECKAHMCYSSEKMAEQYTDIYRKVLYQND